MTTPARVKSIDEMQRMAAALAGFHADASAALDELDMEVRRAMQWLGDECRQFWKLEVRRSTERVAEARIALEHAQMFRDSDGLHGSCIEEKKILEREKHRLQIAETKVEAVKHWTGVLDRAINEYRAVRSQFGNWLEGDFPKAEAAMGRMIVALDAYVHLGTQNDHTPIAPAEKASEEEKKEENNQ